MVWPCKKNGRVQTAKKARNESNYLIVKYLWVDYK
jgi:hypothetical protein